MQDAQLRRVRRAAMVAMTERIIADYAGGIPAGSVMRTVARCEEALLRTGVRHGLVPAAEAMARVELAGRISAHAAE